MLAAFLAMTLAPAPPAAPGPEASRGAGATTVGPVAVCPLAPAPPPASPAAAPGGPPVPRVSVPPATTVGDDDIVVKGLLLRPQADGAYLVFDLAHRHVGTIRPDGSLAPPEPFRRPGSCDRVPLHGGPDPECMADAQLLTNQGQSAGAADAALALVWALARGARQASRNPRARGETPTPTTESVRTRTAPARTKIARRYHVALYCEGLTGLSRALGRVHGARRGNPAGQRAALFRLWDAVADRFPRPGSGLPVGAVTEVEKLRERAIAHGRALVEQFVRARHPAAGDAAYGPRELEALNRTRRSPAPFDPYGAAEP